jgi:hypothetical protein
LKKVGPWTVKDKQWQAEFDAEVARKMEEAGFEDVRVMILRSNN